VNAAEHPFDVYVRRPAETIRVAEAALLYALDEYPSLDRQVYLAFLDQLAERAAASGAVTPRDQAEALRRIVVEEERLTGGDREDYTNPDNSYLNRVIERRCGIPITLSVVWLDVAWALGWAWAGVGAPGQFLIRPLDASPEIYVDPYNGGAVLNGDEALTQLSALLRTEEELPASALATVDAPYILRRMLGNLVTAYRARRDGARQAAALERLVAVAPDEIGLRAELGRTLASAGRFREATEVLRKAELLAFQDEERHVVGRAAAEVKQRFTELN